MENGNNQIPINFEEQMDFFGDYEEEPVEDVMTTENRIREFWSDKLDAFDTIEIIDFIIKKSNYLKTGSL